MVASVGVRSTLIACAYPVWLRSATHPTLPTTTEDYLEGCCHSPEILEEEEGVTGVFFLCSARALRSVGVTGILLLYI